MLIKLSFLSEAVLVLLLNSAKGTGSKLRSKPAVILYNSPVKTSASISFFDRLEFSNNFLYLFFNSLFAFNIKYKSKNEKPIQIDENIYFEMEVKIKLMLNIPITSDIIAKNIQPKKHIEKPKRLVNSSSVAF